MTSRRTTSTSRRRYLKRAGATAGALGLAGCVGDFGDDGDSSPDGNESPTDGTDGESGSGAPGENESENETGANSTGGTDEEPTPGNETEGGEGNETDDGEGNESSGTDPDDSPEVHADYETTEVSIVSADGEELGSVTAAIADTYELRYLGLSDTESLPEDRGMLFVYEEVADRTFVMREMDFGIDIVYADDEGVITSIHHAPAPGPGEDGEAPEHSYPGRGQYVLEVNYEWTAERGVEAGDILEFDL